MHKAELAATLADMLALVEADDSFEGSIRYTCMDESIPEGSQQFEVAATYRTGNSMGQDGMRMCQASPGSDFDGEAKFMQAAAMAKREGKF